MVECPTCKIEMMLLESTAFRHRDGSTKKLYVCPTCDCRHGSHPNGEPVGMPADRPTREARVRLHTLFDPLWKNQYMSRNEAYRLLQRLNDGIRVHMGGMSKAECDTMYDKLFTYYEQQYPEILCSSRNC